MDEFEVLDLYNGKPVHDILRSGIIGSLFCIINP